MAFLGWCIGVPAGPFHELFGEEVSSAENREDSRILGAPRISGIFSSSNLCF
jgi:hypothetical protein